MICDKLQQHLSFILIIQFACRRKALLTCHVVVLCSVMESQHIVNVNWDRLQTISNSILSTITTTAATNATATDGGVGLSIQSILGNNSTAASFLPITNTMSNLGIPLTDSTAMGFTIGILKG
jgi:predicted ABC-type sugar transport system permease subunit